MIDIKPTDIVRLHLRTGEPVALRNAIVLGVSQQDQATPPVIDVICLDPLLLHHGGSATWERSLLRFIAVEHISSEAYIDGKASVGYEAVEFVPAPATNTPELDGFYVSEDELNELANAIEAFEPGSEQVDPDAVIPGAIKWLNDLHAQKVALSSGPSDQPSPADTAPDLAYAIVVDGATVEALLPPTANLQRLDGTLVAVKEIKVGDILEGNILIDSVSAEPPILTIAGTHQK